MSGSEVGPGSGDAVGSRGRHAGAREPTLRRAADYAETAGHNDHGTHRDERFEDGTEIPEQLPRVPYAGQDAQMSPLDPTTAEPPRPEPSPRASRSRPETGGRTTLPDRDDRPLDRHPELSSPRLPTPRSGGAPRDRAQHRAAIHRRFEELAACKPGSDRHRVIRDELIAEHMNYARYVASRFSVPADNAEDLEQVAYLALIKAVDNFDPARGTAFLGYLTPMVTGEIKRYFRDATWDVHVPRRMQELSLALHGAPAEQLERRLGRSPTIAELAEHLGALPEEIVEAFDASAAYSATSLERPLVPGDEQGASLGETLGEDDDAYQWVVDREALKPLLAALPERDKRILLMRFFRGMTQSQIGAELGVSQMQVSRYLTRILGTLRDAVLHDDEDGPGGSARSNGTDDGDANPVAGRRV